MRVVIEHFEKSKVFEDKHNITIGRDESSDFVINNLAKNIEIKFIYNEKFKNYVLINSSGSSDVLVNNRNFSKVLTPAHFFLEIKGLSGKLMLKLTLNKIIIQKLKITKHNLKIWNKITLRGLTQ